MGWLRKWGAWLIGALLGVSGVWALRRRRAALLAAENNATVIASRAHVSALRATRAVLQERSGARTNEIAAVDAAIEAHKSRIATVQASHGLSAQEIADEFSRHGY
jgi:hypothetical protein